MLDVVGLTVALVTLLVRAERVNGARQCLETELLPPERERVLSWASKQFDHLAHK